MEIAAARRKLATRILGTVAALLGLWLVGSGFAVWTLTHRRGPSGEEPSSRVEARGIESHRLRTDDGILLGSWLIRREGARPTVLLLHGNGGSRSSFAGLMPILARQGCGVMAISLRAHGDSEGTVNDFGWSARRDVLTAIRYLERERPGRPLVIVGESLGAAAAVFSAKECAGHVQGYLLAAPYGDLKTAVWNRCDARLFPPLSQAAYAGLLLWAPAFLPTRPDSIRPIDHLEEIPADVTVTLFASERDRYARIGEIRSLYDRIRTHARWISVPDGDHGRFLRIHEEEYHRAISERVDQVDRAR